MIFEFGAAFFQLHDEHVDGFQEIDRFEATNDDGNAKLANEVLVIATANDGANVARGDETLHAILGMREQSADGGRHENVRNEQAEISQAEAFGLQNGHGMCGSGGLKTDGEENDFAVGESAREIHGVRRRVNDANVAAFGLDVEQIGFRAGYAEHVAIRNQRNFRAAGQMDGAVDNFERCNADGAARTVDEFNAIVEQLVDAIAHKGVRLAATNLHEDPWPRRTPANFRG